MDTKPLIDNTSKLHFSQGLSCPGGCFCAFFRCIFPTFAPILPMSAVISGVLWANSGLPPQNTGTVFYPCSLDRNRRNVIIFITHQHLPESDGRNITAQKHHPHRSHRRPRRGENHAHQPYSQGVQAGGRLEGHHHPRDGDGAYLRLRHPPVRQLRQYGGFPVFRH